MTRFSEFVKTLQIEEIDGQLQCQYCYHISNSGKYDKKKNVVSWKCPCGEINVVQQ